MLSKVYEETIWFGLRDEAQHQPNLAGEVMVRLTSFHKRKFWDPFCGTLQNAWLISTEAVGQ